MPLTHNSSWAASFLQFRSLTTPLSFLWASPFCFFSLNPSLSVLFFPNFSCLHYLSWGHEKLKPLSCCKVQQFIQNCSCLHKTSQFETFMILSVILKSIIVFLLCSDSTINPIKKDGIWENKNTVTVIVRDEHLWNVRGKWHVTMTTGQFHQGWSVWSPKAAKQDPGSCSQSGIAAINYSFLYQTSWEYLIPKIYVVLPFTVKILFMSFSCKQDQLANPD